MMCLDDSDLILFVGGKIQAPSRIRQIESHILECEVCMERYKFLLTLEEKERNIFGSLQQDDFGYDSSDIFIYPTTQDKESPLFVNLSGKLIIVEDSLLTRGEEILSRRALRIQKRTFPSMCLLEGEKESSNWFFYLDQDVSSLTLLEDDKIRYKSSYQKEKLLTVPVSPSLYKVIVNNRTMLSFKWVVLVKKGR